VAEKLGTPAYLVDDAGELNPEWFEGKGRVGVTAGASAPEVLVQQVLERLRQWGGFEVVETEGQLEHVVFSLPKGLS
jgi:4-hydroxy-3-methylbut-2-enyl diphosphate reductase